MQVYKYTVHGQNSLVMGKPNKKTQKACQQCELQEPFHEMAPETSSVIGYGEVHVQCEKTKHCHYCSDKETEERHISYRNLGQCGQAQVKNSNADALLEMSKPLRKHHLERSDLSNLTNENPRPNISETRQQQ